MGAYSYCYCYHLLPILLPLLPLHYLCYHMFPTVTTAQYLDSEYLSNNAVIYVIDIVMHLF